MHAQPDVELVHFPRAKTLWSGSCEWGLEKGYIDTNFVFFYFRAMKNVTVTLSDDIALWLRVRAAEQNCSMSKWLAELIEGMRRREDEYEIAMERFLARARKPRKLEWVDGRRPTRDELHDRAGLR